MEERNESLRSQPQEKQHSIARDHKSRSRNNDTLKGFSLLKSEMPLRELPTEMLLGIASIAGNSNMIDLLEAGRKIETTDSIPVPSRIPVPANTVTTAPPETADNLGFSRLGLHDDFDIGTLIDSVPVYYAELGGSGAFDNG